MKMYNIHIAGLILVLAFVFGETTASARMLFVNNRTGSNEFDGTNSATQNSISGPVKSINRALELAEPGDTIMVANTGIPYYESLQLVGKRFSGVGNSTFKIMGNGSILSGARAIPRAGWREVKLHLWKVTPARKGHYQLVRNHAKVPETIVPRGSKSIPEIPVGNWCVWQGSIYYHGDADDVPPQQRFAFASEQVGITLFAVRDVEIHDFQIRHFRLDGINAHDLAKNILIYNVNATQNGRSGISVNGTSQVAIQNCSLLENRKEALLLSELGYAELLDTEMPALADETAK